MQQALIGGGALAHRLRSVAVVQHLLEHALGLVEVVVGERVESVPLLRGVAEGAVRGHQRSERALHLLAIRSFQNDQRRAQHRDLLHELVDGGVLADRRKLFEGLRPVGPGLRGADARQRGVALRSVLGDGVEGGGGLRVLAFIGERDGGLEARIGGLGALEALVLIIAPGARRGDDEEGGDENRRLVSPPEFGGPVPADVLVNFLKNI